MSETTSETTRIGLKCLCGARSERRTPNGWECAGCGAFAGAIERDSYTGHPIEKSHEDSEPEPERKEPDPVVERTTRIALSSVDDRRQSSRFLATVETAPFLVGTGDTPGEALAALGARIDADLVNRAWDALVPPDADRSES